MSKNIQSKINTSFIHKATLALLGLFLTVIILEAGLRLGGFIFLSLQEYRNRVSIQRKSTYRIMCLGESTTAGQYPSFLQEELDKHNIGIEFSVIDKGVVGIDTSFILNKIIGNLDTYNPDMVITMMGINDGSLHIPYEAATISNTQTFFKSFRVYKLVRLLWLHVTTKLKEIDTGKDIIQAQPFFKKNALQKTEPASQPAESGPQSHSTHTKLGWTYRKQGKFTEAEDSFKKAIALNPKNDWAHTGLGWTYQNQSKFTEAEDSFKKAIQLNSQNDRTYVELGIACREQYKFIQAEDSFKQAIQLNPQNDKAYAALKSIYIEMRDLELAEKYNQKVKELGLKYYPSVKASNYLKLKEVLDKRGITYVCVQYPTRNIEPLKKVFQDNDKGIIFVDNEKIFKDVLGQGKYTDYFTDFFGGDFGHCTDKGNKLLAENIAKVILKEVFNR